MAVAKRTAKSDPAKAGAQRKAHLRRDTKETQLRVSLNVDGEGKFSGRLGVPFFEHMMDLFARHSLMDIEVDGRGDLEVDAHHTVEDVGIVLGQALKAAVGDKKGIERYGEAYVPMEEVLARCVLDICNRPYLRFDAKIPKAKIGNFDAELAEEFLRALAFNAGITMHITVFYGKNLHHVLEAVFKSVGRALARATALNPRIHGVFSTKGTL
jgi:imidazoleglycerol-phosphate dehydratase